jgi:hypothetical protein
LRYMRGVAVCTHAHAHTHAHSTFFGDSTGDAGVVVVGSELNGVPPGNAVATADDVLEVAWV